RPSLGFVLSICALALAASCVSPEELRREDEAACTGYGFKPGTNDFFQLPAAGEPRAALRNSAPFAGTILGILGILGSLVGALLALDGMDAYIDVRRETAVSYLGHFARASSAGRAESTGAIGVHRSGNDVAIAGSWEGKA